MLRSAVRQSPVSAAESPNRMTGRLAPSRARSMKDNPVSEHALAPPWRADADLPTRRPPRLGHLARVALATCSVLPAPPRFLARIYALEEMERPPSPPAPPLASGPGDLCRRLPVPDFIAAQRARLAKAVLSDRARYEKRQSDRAKQVERSLNRGLKDGQYQWVPVSEHAGADGHSRLSLRDAAGTQGIRRGTATAYQPRSRCARHLV